MLNRNKKQAAEIGSFKCFKQYQFHVHKNIFIFV